MSEPGTEDDNQNDPFHPNNIDKVALIVNLRIYDALMANLAALSMDDKEDIERLHQLVFEAHSNGKVLGSLPWLDLSQE